MVDPKKKRPVPKPVRKQAARQVPADKGTGAGKAAAHKGSAAQARKNPSNGRKTAVMKDGSVATVTSKNGKPVLFEKTSPSNTGKMRTTRRKLPM